MSDYEQVVGGEREGMAGEGLGGPQGAKLALSLGVKVRPRR